MKFKRQSQEEEVGVNLTPLIDVVFLLLIFFMISTTFTKESHLKVELPEASAAASDDTPDQLEVIIAPDGDISVNNRVLVDNNIATVKKALRETAAGDTRLPFIITADANTPHQFVVRVMDAAGQLGFVNLRITTKQTNTE